LFLLAAVVSMALLVVVSGCNRPSATPPDEAAALKTPEVKVVRPEKKDVRRLIGRPGYNIEAYERTPLYAKIAGYARIPGDRPKWPFDMGDRVHKGDILAEVYIPEMEVELRQKDAGVRQAAAEILQAKAAVQRAEAEQDRAKTQYARLEQVGKGGLLSKDQVDELRLGFEAAQAALSKALADLSTAEAGLEKAKADRDHVQTLLQYTKIPAPYDGVITRRIVSTGDFVQPAGAGKGEALFIMEQVDPVRVFANVQELEAVWVRAGDTAVILPQSLSGQQFKGTVTRFSGALNPLNRTLRTEIDLPNREDKLKPGMYVAVKIIAEHKKVWALPAAAVVTKGEETFCFRVEDGKAVRTLIQVGLRGNERDNELVEVVKKLTKPARSGEEAYGEDWSGEEVIVATDPASLTDGQTVIVASGKE
jgi:RND family efflux transporter MFP subunit